MEERFQQAEGLLQSLQRHFPLASMEKSVTLLTELAESYRDPQLAVTGIVLYLIEAATKEPGKKGREKSGEPITWDQVWILWQLLQKSILQLKQKVAPLNRTKTFEGDSALHLQGIYEFVGMYVVIDRAAHSFPATALARFLQLTVTHGHPSSPHDRHDSSQKMSLADFKIVALTLAQLVGLDDVHLGLSECLVFLNVSDGSGGVVAFPKEEDGQHDFLPAVFPLGSLSGVPAHLNRDDLWMCTKKQFVHCNRHMEFAYLICFLDSEDFRKLNGPLAALQLGVLSYLYQANKLKTYPVVVAIYGYLNLLTTNDDQSLTITETLLLEAIKINQETYANAYVAPYVILFDYLSSLDNKIPAVLPAFLASEVIRQYHYIPSSLDKRLYDELFRMANAMEQFITKDFRSHRLNDSTVAGLLIGFIDNFCLWEEKSGAAIWHSTWSAKLIRSCLNKMTGGPMQQVMLHGGATSMCHAVGPVQDYVSSTLAGLRDLDALPRSFPVKSEPSDDLPADLELDDKFCRLALKLYETWPPMRLDVYPDSFLRQDRMAMIGRVPNPQTARSRYEAFLRALRDWPTVPCVSDQDLEVIGKIRAVNPLYRPCFKHVFPFLDMGPPDIPLFCFDTDKIRKEVKYPLPAMPESDIIHKLQCRLNELTGTKAYPDGPSAFSHVLLKSQKMLSIRGLLGQEKLNQAEICLKMEGSAAGPVGGAGEKRDRRPSAKACLR